MYKICSRLHSESYTKGSVYELLQEYDFKEIEEIAKGENLFLYFEGNFAQFKYELEQLKLGSVILTEQYCR